TGPSARRPTLKDVAREAGFHVTTISLALRSHPSIPEATRVKIKTIADRMGYEVNPVFHALSRFRKSGRVRAPAPRIAFIENYGAGTGLKRAVHAELILEGARRQAGVLGYDLDLLALGEDDLDAHSIAQHLARHQTTGLIIGGFVPGFAELALNWDDYSVVKIHSRHTEPDVTVVANDQLREVRLAFRRLTALGYRRIGLAVGRADEDGCGHRHAAGFLMEQATVPPERRVPPLIFSYYATHPTLAGTLGRWVRRHSIDAVICNWTTTGDMLALSGLAVPAQVAWACLCLTSSDHATAGVRPNLDLVGERAVSILVSKLKSTERGTPEFPSSIYVQSSWQDGASAPARV
ncbi:MAG: LacI family DNA-binding transcriptional regulator, partial [Opitutaceae bacterium]|nr:LacI family DNA-binding transcriptional regulator [Opitutaceae bacterium]